MNLAFIVVALYGIFTLAGGLMGYVKAGSTASLIAGGVSGLVLLACAYGIRQGARAALIVSIVAGLLLGIRFFMTWTQHHRLMPDLLMIIFSTAAVLAAALPLLRR